MGERVSGWVGLAVSKLVKDPQTGGEGTRGAVLDSLHEPHLPDGIAA